MCKVVYCDAVLYECLYALASSRLLKYQSHTVFEYVIFFCNE